MRLTPRLRGLLALTMLAATFAAATVDVAEARRGGSFGSRGARTYSAPAATPTAPGAPGGLQRSMTPRDQAAPGAAARTPGAAQQQQRGGMFGGLAGGLVGGLMLGGLVGLMMGGGLGGMAGILGLIVQVGIIAVIAMLVMRFIRRRNAGGTQPAFAAAGATPYTPEPETARTPYIATAMAGGANRGQDAPARGAEVPAAGGSDEIGLDAGDFDAFEQLLSEVQAAFSREDFAQLRARCTPEIVSFLSEELSENAVKGVRNDVTDVRLLQGDLSEAWRESGNDFATVAMRYESVDVTRNRNSGEIVEGSTSPTETTEVWTFVRPTGASWKLSAIQAAA